VINLKKKMYEIHSKLAWEPSPEICSKLAWEPSPIFGVSETRSRDVINISGKKLRQSNHDMQYYIQYLSNKLELKT
jgi:hypothetical protein